MTYQELTLNQKQVEKILADWFSRNYIGSCQRFNWHNGQLAIALRLSPDGYCADYFGVLREIDQLPEVSGTATPKQS